jgi:hypothetical protein
MVALNPAYASAASPNDTQNRVGDFFGGMLGWVVVKTTGNRYMVDASNEQMSDAYDGSAFGQTVDDPNWTYYGTRGAWGVSTVGTAGYVFVQTPLTAETKARILMEAALIYQEGNPGGPTGDDMPPKLPPPPKPVPTQPIND